MDTALPPSNSPSPFCCHVKALHLLDPGNLDHPPHVGGVDLVLNEPGGQVLPLAGRAAVNGQSGLSVLVFTVLQLLSNLLKHDKAQEVRLFPHRAEVDNMCTSCTETLQYTVAIREIESGFKYMKENKQNSLLCFFYDTAVYTGQTTHLLGLVLVDMMTKLCKTIVQCYTACTGPRTLV